MDSKDFMHCEMISRKKWTEEKLPSLPKNNSNYDNYNDNDGSSYAMYSARGGKKGFRQTWHEKKGN